jgi:hypothetical protein
MKTSAKIPFAHGAAGVQGDNPSVPGAKASIALCAASVSGRFSSVPGINPSPSCAKAPFALCTERLLADNSLFPCAKAPFALDTEAVAGGFPRVSPDTGAALSSREAELAATFQKKGGKYALVESFFFNEDGNGQEVAGGNQTIPVPL